MSLHQRDTTQNTVLHVMKIEQNRAGIENIMLIVRFVAKRFGKQNPQLQLGVAIHANNC